MFLDVSHNYIWRRIKIIHMKKLPDKETERLLRKYKIPFPEHVLTKSEDSAVRAAKRIGFPVAMKVSSPDILHKTDAGCVILDVRDEEGVRKAYRQIIRNARKNKQRARIEGVSVEEMIPEGTREVIIGAKQDPQFGPVLMFGLGGIFVEVLKDVSFGVVPLERGDAAEMVREIRGFRILEGVRGQKPVNMRLLEMTIMKVSRMVWENSGKGKRIQELDINPLFIDEKNVWAADVRVLV
ncbi:MAG: acetyl-CoA synthetase [Candidatus Aenigmatarchaeota archaeon]|nr:MAG: acetyl-CoA synthetase [Candidatus Aenigmarchaeota archaeon]